MSLKSIARALARPFRMRIRSGPCAGMWFSLASRSRFLRGSYELKMATFVASQIRPGDVFWDVGAHFGYYTLVAAKAGARVHAFEPDPDNRAFLTRHVRWNSLDAVVHECALGDADGTGTFGGGRGSGGRSVGGGERPIAIRSMKSLVSSGTCERPDFLKIDVQGGEVNVFMGACDVLRDAPIIIACASHGREIHERCKEGLSEIGYELRSNADRNVILAFGKGRSVPDVDAAALDM